MIPLGNHYYELPLNAEIRRTTMRVPAYPYLITDETAAALGAAEGLEPHLLGVAAIQGSVAVRDDIVLYLAWYKQLAMSSVEKSHPVSLQSLHPPHSTTAR